MKEVFNGDQLLTTQLGALLEIEQTSLAALAELRERADSDELKQQLSHHYDETEQQLANVKQAFEKIGQPANPSPAPGISGLQKEAQTQMKTVVVELIDAVIGGAAAATEHYEIAHYTSTITLAEKLGKDDVVELLKENLEQEQHTLEELDQASSKLVAKSLEKAAEGDDS